MTARSWFIILLLTNYLLVVGVGCVSRPEDQRAFVMVLQTSQQTHAYQECRYLRMDSLEDFLADALANQYQTSTPTAKHFAVSVVFGIDSHYLTPTTWLLSLVASRLLKKPSLNYYPPSPAQFISALDIPPWQV